MLRKMNNKLKKRDRAIKMNKVEGRAKGAQNNTKQLIKHIKLNKKENKVQESDTNSHTMNK